MSDEAPSVLRLLYRRWKFYGLRSLYNGFSITVPRAFVSSAVVFTVYEWVHQSLDNKLESKSVDVDYC